MTKLESQKPLSLPRKVKLKLVQPEIMCSGRDEVTAYYRGKITHETETTYNINFKYKGEEINRLYVKNEGFRHKEIRDIKLVG